MRIFIAICILFAGLSASAAEVDNTTLKQLENYLNTITTLQADFTQISPEGALSSGVFYLSRPGKLRWEYNPPTPILIVADGSTLMYYDKELDQLSNVLIGDNLAGFLTRKNISFSGDIKIIQQNQQDNVARITIIQAKKPLEGALTLVFELKPLALKKIEIADANQKVTQVTFSNEKFGMPLEPKLFTVERPAKR